MEANVGSNVALLMNSNLKYAKCCSKLAHVKINFQ